MFSYKDKCGTGLKHTLLVESYSLCFNEQILCSEPKWKVVLNDGGLPEADIKLATLVKSDPKAPFSTATTPRC